MGESMIRRFVRLGVFAIVLAATPPLGSVLAQPAVQALLPTVIPVVAKGRAEVVNHPSLAATEIEHVIREAVNKAKTTLTSSKRPAEAQAILQPLESTIGPLRTIPFFDLHQLMAAMAGMEGRTDDQMYHRAFAVALLIAINETGTGKSAESALRVVMVSEQTAWFSVQRDMKPKTRLTNRIDGRAYDIWTVTMTSGEERQVYFDVTAMIRSLERVLAARQAGQKPQ